jgi:hypothetical protein
MLLSNLAPLLLCLFSLSLICYLFVSSEYEIFSHHEEHSLVLLLSWLNVLSNVQKSLIQVDVLSNIVAIYHHPVVDVFEERFDEDWSKNSLIELSTCGVAFFTVGNLIISL